MENATLQLDKKLQITGQKTNSSIGFKKIKFMKVAGRFVFNPKFNSII